MPTENGAARGQLSNVSPNGREKKGGRRRSRQEKRARHAQQLDAVRAFVKQVDDGGNVPHEEMILGVACVGKKKPGNKMDITVGGHKVHGSISTASRRSSLVKLVLGVMHQHHLLGREDSTAGSKKAAVGAAN